MKTFLFVAALLLCGSVYGQEDSTIYRFGLPVSNDDTARQFLERDMEPRNELTEVPVNELPDEVLEALDSQDQYKGWRDSTVYYEENTGHYLVHVKREDGIRVFGLSENGEVVTFDMVTESP